MDSCKTLENMRNKTLIEGWFQIAIAVSVPDLLFFVTAGFRRTNDSQLTSEASQFPTHGGQPPGGFLAAPDGAAAS